MLVTYDLPNLLIDRFRMALNFTQDQEQAVIQQFLLQYIQQAFTQELASLSHYVPAVPVHSLPVPAPSSSSVDCAKALRRLPAWANRPHQINHQVIRAFFACERDGVASREQMRRFFIENTRYTLVQFDYNFTNMCTESGNSHGKVFDAVDDRVTLAAPVEAPARQLQAQFYPQR